MSKISGFKSLLAFILVLAIALPFSVTTSQAAGTAKAGWVSIDSGALTVRSGPGTNYQKVGSLMNNAAVTVYSQLKNGWSQINYNNKKAYVSSQYVRMYSFLMDKTKIYTYKTEGSYYKTQYAGKYRDWDKWVDNEGFYITKEDNKGLYTDWPNAAFFTDLVYPLKVGTEWTDWEVKNKIIAINGTLKTPAGTFKNVVTIKSSDGYTTYFAQNVGFLKAVSNGVTMSELTSLIKK